MNITLGMFIKDISYEKRGLINEPGAEEQYSPYIINDVFSRFYDCIFLIDEVNRNPPETKQAHYNILMYGLPKRKRFERFEKIPQHEHFGIIQKHYDLSYSKTQDIIGLLSTEQVKTILEQSGYYNNGE